MYVCPPCPLFALSHTYLIIIIMSQGLGFERGAVLRALQASGNNVEVAANRLLTGG